MDSQLPVFDYSIFKMEPGEFKEYYRDAEEQFPRVMPRPRGKSVVTTAFVDASHAANKVTRRSHSEDISCLSIEHQ